MINMVKKVNELLAINRRNFIKLFIGGAVGTSLSPLPWKLTDDLAIWTQNWPWVPVSSVGEFIHEKTVCTLCPGGCGIEVRFKVKGNMEKPYLSEFIHDPFPFSSKT